MPESARSARIAKRLKLDDYIEKEAKKEAFIFLKDHKPTLHYHPCHLINPSKSEIGAISKHILDEVNTSIINVTHKSTSRRTRPAS